MFNDLLLSQARVTLSLVPSICPTDLNACIFLVPFLGTLYHILLVGIYRLVPYIIRICQTVHNFYI